MTVPQRLRDDVLDLTRMAQERGTDPLIWAMQLSSTLTAAGVSLPSTEVADILVSYICWSNNVPIAWKFLEKALTIHVLPPMLVLALLSIRVVPARKMHPVAYRLYMELLKRYAFSLPSLINGPNYHKIMESINHVLNLYEIFRIQSSEPGLLVVEFMFSIVWELLDASLDDEGLLELTPKKNSRWSTISQCMEIDYLDSFGGKKVERRAAMSKENTVMAVEIISEFFQNKITSGVLYLAGQNMPSDWEYFIQNLRLLVENSTSLRNSKKISPEALLQLTSDASQVLSHEYKKTSQRQLHEVTARSHKPSVSKHRGTIHSAVWLPIDLFLANMMDGSQVTTTSATETLTGLMKALQALNQTTWQDVFFGLWIASLRLVQRERNSNEGPIPRLDTCLCMLLSISTLAIVSIVEEEEVSFISQVELSSFNQRKDLEFMGKRHQDLVSSLQRLNDFEVLLIPPPPISSLANQAAAKAKMFLSGQKIGSGHLDGFSLDDMPLNCSGNLRHLIVEACIARNILDTSAYLWPGYVNDRCDQIPRSVSRQMPGWSMLMKGSPLTPLMITALVSTPASSLAEIERLYEIAVNGTHDEKISAATIFCGASLIRGWNIQDHVVLFIIRLLSPAVPPDFSGSDSHLISYASFFNVLLAGISSVDCIQIFSLHGLVPQLAGALMPICEVFGSCAPNKSWFISSGEEIFPHAVFSNAFTLLLKLWRFDQTPLECIMGDGDVSPVGSRLTPEYLLLVRNSKLEMDENQSKNQINAKKLPRMHLSFREPIFMDSFPKLKRWYRQNQECIASILSILLPGTPAHQIVEALLNMMFRKSRGGQPPTSSSSGSSSSSASGADDSSIHIKLPAWDILEAVPFVLDAALTACAHGRISPRELITGLKDLVDFLPASMATIVSYFAAEVTRGLWKPVFMNGTDWPSPAENLSMVEKQIKKILVATGVNVPHLSVGGSSPVTLPLPLAALVSLTITFKLDKDTDRFLYLVGPALGNLITRCPWPCMPIVIALWAQKVKRWSDFLVFSASRTVFYHNSDAVVQLLRGCFAIALGKSSYSVPDGGGIGALLGHGFGSHFGGGITAVAPGILYLRVHRAVRNVMFMTEEIVSLLMHTVKDIVNNGQPTEKVEKRNITKYNTKYGQVSLSMAMTRVKIAASLGASLVWITGGLSLVQFLIKETLPSWFISSVHKSEPNGDSLEGMAAMLHGYALAYFTVFSGVFAWGVDLASPASKRRPNAHGKHFEFIASALDGKISLGCNKATWRAYVTGYMRLMVRCTPIWMLEVDVEILKRVSKGLKQWNEEQLAIDLLGISGIHAMGTAAEMIIQTGF